MNGNKRKRAKLLAFKYLFLDIARLLAAPSVFLFLRPKRLYENEAAQKPIRGAAVLITNHDSFLDPMYVMVALWYRRVRFVATSDLYYHKSLAFFLNLVRCIEVDKKNFNFATFRKVNEALDEGEVVAIFPEGSINDGSRESVRVFKSGAVLMAQKAGAPIVPIYIDQRPHWYNRQRYMIGEPIGMERKEGERASLADIDRITETLYQKELKLKSMMMEYNSKRRK